MQKFVIGLMSGTSLDGLDIAYVQFIENETISFKILQAETISYSKKWYQKLKDAFTYSAEQLAQLDADYGVFLGEKINEFIKKNQIEKVDLIASHGQTVFHRPEKGYTTQIGSGFHIFAQTGIKTVFDFRRQDVALGGQGAPLVPIGDRLLFSDYDYCLNIGGFANISYQQNDKTVAFDICPTNIVMNHYVNKLGLEYDDKGQLARKGKLNKPLLDELNTLDFYKDDKPKSLGWEYVVEVIIPLIDKYKMEVQDVLHTYVEHIAVQIARKTGKGKMLITGGGAFNHYLIERISALSDTEVIIPDKTIIEYKEALIFALLGYLRAQSRVNVLSSVTGAKYDHSSGVLVFPK